MSRLIHSLFINPLQLLSENQHITLYEDEQENPAPISLNIPSPSEINDYFQNCLSLKVSLFDKDTLNIENKDEKDFKGFIKNLMNFDSFQDQGNELQNYALDTEKPFALRLWAAHSFEFISKTPLIEVLLNEESAPLADPGPFFSLIAPLWEKFPPLPETQIKVSQFISKKMEEASEGHGGYITCPFFFLGMPHLKELYDDTIQNIIKYINNEKNLITNRLIYAACLNRGLPENRLEGFEALLRFANNKKLKLTDRVDALVHSLGRNPDGEILGKDIEESETRLSRVTQSIKNISPKILSSKSLSYTLALHLTSFKSPDIQKLCLPLIKKGLSSITQEGIYLVEKMLGTQNPEYQEIAKKYCEKGLKGFFVSDQLKFNIVNAIVENTNPDFLKDLRIKTLLSILKNKKNSVSFQLDAALTVLKENDQTIQTKAVDCVKKIIEKSKADKEFLNSLGFLIVFVKNDDIHETARKKSLWVFQNEKVKDKEKIIAAGHLLKIGTSAEKEEAYTFLESFTQQAEI